MNALVELREAVLGWIDLLAGRAAQGVGRFNTTREGAVNAIGFYVAAVLLRLLIDTLQGAAPTPPQIFQVLAINVLPLGGVAAVILGTIKVLKLPVRFNAMFVPAMYALTLALAVGMLISFLDSPMFSNVLLGILGFMFFRMARAAGHMNIGVSVAFAALSIVVLVALPLGLYMLSQPAPPAA